MILRKNNPSGSLGNSLPQSPEKLKQIRDLIRDYAAERELIPPLQEEEVIFHSGELIKKHPELFLYQKLLAVMINNHSWRDIVSGIPFNRRILLLPKCISHSTECPAQFDELGLLCEQCGKCDIADILTQADELGYHTLVSEGTTTVTTLLTSGKVECVIGVGCLHSFERSFPLAVKEGVPSIAIPLYNNNCKDSKVDEIWLNEVLPIRKESNWRGWINIDALRSEVDSWFEKEQLENILEGDDKSSQISRDWLADGGKRWRPLIMVAVYKALMGTEANLDECIQKLAVSIESFHKASLVHDDIVDDDNERYGKPTLHKQYDTSVAINIGDLILGYGYQLIAESGAKHMRKLLKVAAHGHRDLSIGQGEELLWRLNKKLLSVDKIINIFSLKTSPAFEVALKFGAIISDADDEVMNVLTDYSSAMGIAYQIKDDLDDFNLENIGNAFNTIQPSLVTAIINRKYPNKMEAWFKAFQNEDDLSKKEIWMQTEIREGIKEAEQMLEDYKLKALSSLSNLKSPALKILLTRLLNKILNG
ncbi:polyprenyl synthetase family protein [Ancylomarina sp.]|uniref:polyprenyl synthetase family protein n=1 Tax=Ancylomarina sp. TaxID=1970196 RepID=UPI003568E46C